MQTIIIGCGTVGSTITGMLVKEGHNVTVMDIDSDRVQSVVDRYDVMGIVASGANSEDLIEAGVKDTDLVISCTSKDEMNLLCCMVAKKAGGCQTVARVSSSVMARQAEYLKDEMGLSLLINPKHASALAITRMLKYPAAIDVETFAGGRVELSSYKLYKGNVLIGCALKDIQSRVKCDVLVCMVERKDEVFIPSGDFVLEAGDVISVVADSHNIMQFMHKIGIETNRIRQVMIAGGSTTAEYLAKMLMDIHVDVTIIESKKERCEELCEILPKARIIHGDGTDKSVLLEEGLMSCDAFVSLTSRDEENILLSLFVKSICDAKVITRIHHISYDTLINKFNVGSIIVPQRITGNNVMRFVRAMDNSLDSNVETLYQLADDRIEAMEFVVKPGSSIIGKPLKDLKLKDQTLIASIFRYGFSIIPGGNDSIMAGDKVVVFTAHTGIGDIKEILQ